MKVEKLKNNKGYVLTVSTEVAGVLLTIFKRIGGDPQKSPRGVVDCLRELLRFAGGKPKFGSPFRSFNATGGISFENCGVERLEKEIAEAYSEMQAAETAGAPILAPKYYRIVKSWRGGSKTLYIALNETEDLTKEMLEQIGNNTSGGENYGFSITSKKIKNIPKDARILPRTITRIIY